MDPIRMTTFTCRWSLKRFLAAAKCAASARSNQEEQERQEGEEELPGEEDGEEGDVELVASSSDVEEFLQTERDTFLSRNEKMTRSSSPLDDQGRMVSQKQCFQVCWDSFLVFGMDGIPSPALWEVLTCTDL